MALLLGAQVSGEAIETLEGSVPDPGVVDLSQESLSRLDRSCTLCHEVDAAFSHPTGITPSMAVPEDFPLIRNTIACITCHESDSAREHVNSPAMNRVQLRSELSGSALCVECHEPFGTNSVDAHASSMSSAHPGGVSVRGYGQGKRGLHNGSKNAQERENCRDCHDGSIASDVGHFRDASLGGARFLQGAGGHPVGTEYRMTNPEDADGELRPASQLDPRIRLFDNKVSCQSCHSIYSVRPDHLVMSNDHSALCLGCHLY